MDRLPPIAPAFRTYDYSYPRSLILYLQCAPHNVVLTAFQADCESRDVSWCSARAQELAVEWFLQHPVARKYPPRRRMLRALLKAYITSIEEHCVAERAYAAESAESETVQLELMQAYIELSVSGGEYMRDTEMSFKTFFNPYVGGPDSPPMYACGAPVPAPPTTSSLMHLTANHSSPSQLNPPAGGYKLATTSEGDVRVAAAAATAATYSAPRALSEPSHPITPPRVTAGPDCDDLLPMLNIRATSPSSPARSPFGSSHTQPQPQPPPPPPLSLDKILEQFSAMRVSSEQFANVGLSLWPAGFVMAQLLAQEFKGQTHLLTDMLGLPRPLSSVLGNSSNSVPALAAPHKVFSAQIPTPPSSPPAGGRGMRSSVGSASAASKPYSSQLRILELGAGVGLTPIFLHHMEEYRQHVATFLITDYQDSILDNIRYNFKENGITPVVDFTAAKRGLEGAHTPPFHRVAKLDWTNHLDNEGIFMENGVDVVLAADCIYDVEAIPALVDTIHLALTADDISSYLTTCARASPARADLGGSIFSHGNSSTNGSSSASGSLPPISQKRRCCVVVQTHRQNSTMQVFFSAVRKFGHVRSYTLVRQPIGTLNVSADGSGSDGGCVPLGSWDKQSALLNPDRVVCALRRDVVREDGSLSSMAKRSVNQKGRNNSLASNPIGSSLGGTGKTHSRTSAPTAPLSLSSGNFAKDVAFFAPLHSSRSNNSADSHMSFSRNSSSAVMEAAESLLADEMIGPFYTTMVGLVGVHVITLKSSKKVTR
ncbi:hypothetical protein ABB37_01614 [Leptomonas pyrrhocoris]|uniref:Methyltransferase n=1 Tax=Leptomonas pyrrhocoris TaxID=157538 RepID=A0A0M9G9D7_LEPPY|nr:hypothetical protein ABB37_01614 [Leptomonas pyrrhocoris]KPA85269.1 hypothetical protein ABB37_01614 [Leptomonas pyrrhocoris]|eukprot:XP_015663708.1 hypothetical protein ABB37_01614 [Leptomonas pyrrhocoris]